MMLPLPMVIVNGIMVAAGLSSVIALLCNRNDRGTSWWLYCNY